MNISYGQGIGFVCLRILLTKIGPLITFLIAVNSFAFAGEGIEMGRFRVIPILTISEGYSDNIYLVDQNETDDFTTIISPELTFDVAVVPRNYFSLKYRGDFIYYSDADNFREDHHLGSFSFHSKTRKESNFEVGVVGEDTAIQPYSEVDRSKDYTLQTAYGKALLMLGAVTEVGLDYSLREREFDEFQFADDDYTRNRWDFHLLYKRSRVWPILVQYRYIDQDNNDLGAENTDFQSHTVFVGGRWHPDRKLSGALRVGYSWVQFDASEEDDLDGYAIDTELVYAFSEITRFVFSAERSIQNPTRSARESGDYYVFTDLGLNITHTRWHRITTRLQLFYRHREYDNIQSSLTIREDDYYRAGLSVEYAMRDWISFSLEYGYKQNNSDMEINEYSENLGKISIILSL
jgi:hypothetical protein